MSKRPSWLRSVPLHTVLALTAAFVLGSFILLLKLPETPVAQTNVSVGSAVDFAKADDAWLREESSLQDPAPLFLPTAFNSTQAVRPESSLGEPGDGFRVSPKWVFNSGAVPLSLPEPVLIPARPAEELGRSLSDRPFTGFGQKPTTPITLPKREAFIEVRAAGTGELRLGVPVLDVNLQDNVDWKPCEFLVEADAAGMIGEPPLVSSSGADSIDQAFRDYLINQWSSIERKAKLQSGAYRILLGP